MISYRERVQGLYNDANSRRDMSCAFFTNNVLITDRDRVNLTPSLLLNLIDSVNPTIQH